MGHLKQANKVISALAVIVFSSCGKGSPAAQPAVTSPPPTAVAAPATGPTTTATQAAAAFQNPAGCLDLSKLFAGINAGPSSRATWIDSQIDATQPISQEFDRAVADNTPTAVAPAAGGVFSPVPQSGCDSVYFAPTPELPAGATVKITSASTTKLVLDQLPDANPSDPKGLFLQLTYEVLGPGQVQMTVVIPYTTPHDCLKAHQEWHEVTQIFMVDFGSTLPAAEALSQALTTMKATAATVDNPSQAGANWQAEQQYCSQAGGTTQ